MRLLKQKTCASGLRKPSAGCRNCARVRARRCRPAMSFGVPGPPSHEAHDLPPGLTCGTFDAMPDKEVKYYFLRMEKHDHCSRNSECRACPSREGVRGIFLVV